VALGVLAHGQQTPGVEQVVDLAAVDLVEGDEERQVRELRVQQMEDVVRGQQVEARRVVLGAAHHGEGFARARLPVGEARGLQLPEGGVHERTHALVVDAAVRGRAVVHAVEAELRLLDEAGHVHLDLGLPDRELVLRVHLDDVRVAARQLAPVQRPLPDHHADLGRVLIAHLNYN